jgi:predicted small secreted protein
MRSAALLALAFASLTLAACNTMEGAGQDMQNVGRNVQSPAVEHAGQNLEDSAVHNK